MKTFLNAIKKYFADFGTAVAKGDIWCKLSLLVMGAGYWGRKQIVKGVLITALEVVALYPQRQVPGIAVAKDPGHPAAPVF